jgi:hypothetical protein
MHTYYLYICLTFSNKFPSHYRNYGEVEEIVIEEPRLRPHPLCALIIFSSPNTLFSILNGDKRAHFIIKGKDLWVQRNVEDKRAHFTINGKDLFYWG